MKLHLQRGKFSSPEPTCELLAELQWYYDIVVAFIGIRLVLLLFLLRVFTFLGGFGVGEGCLDGVFVFKEILIAKKG